MVINYVQKLTKANCFETNIEHKKTIEIVHMFFNKNPVIYYLIPLYRREMWTEPYVMRTTTIVDRYDFPIEIMNDNKNHEYHI